jgi:predicted O-methyltransferase YrrM
LIGKLCVFAEVTRALQIGFNAGHSAITMLAANPRLHLTSFDLVEHPYVPKSSEFINSVFPGRHVLVSGDSTVTVPAALALFNGPSFDLIFIDGGHSYEVAAADLRNCAKLARAGTIVIMDDVVAISSSYWTKGPTQAWDEAIASHLVVELGRIETSSRSTTGIVVSEPNSVSDGIYGIAFGFFSGHAQKVF